MSLRILLVDDYAPIRAALRELMEMEADWKVCGEAGSSREAVQQAEELAPDVIIMDVMMPGGSGLEATREIVSRHPEVNVLLFTQHELPEMRRMMREVGARGCVLKSSSGRTLVRAVRNLVDGAVTSA